MRSLVLLALAALACGPARTAAPALASPEVAAAPAGSAPAAPAASSAATADAGASAEPPRRPRSWEIDDEPKLGDERERRRALVSRVPFVLRGRVREAKQRTEWKQGVEVGFTYAIVDVLEWLHGDPKLVFERYRKSFPLFTSGTPVRVNKMPSSSERDEVGELMNHVGEERLFFVHLPSEKSAGWSNEGPPAFILARYGKYSVSITEHLALSEKGSVRRAFDDLAAHRQWIADNAARLKVRDRFTPHARSLETSDAGAMADDQALLAAAITARDFVIAEFARAKVALSFAAPERKDHGGNASFYFKEATAGNDTLWVSVTGVSARVQAFQLRGPTLLGLSQRHAVVEDEDLLAPLESALDLHFADGKVFRKVSRPYRGDGALLFDVAFHAGVEAGNSTKQSPRSIDITLTGDPPVVFQYANDWAR